MPATRLRPKYRIVSSLAPKNVLNKIQKKLLEKENPLTGEIAQEHAFIRIPENMQHYWSPELHVWVRREENETIIFGVMGPKPKIWTMFMFLYVAIITSAFFGSSYGIIQMMLGMDAPFLISIPLGILGIIFVYGAAQYGQHRGKEQMLILKRFLDDALEEKSSD